MLAWIYVLCLIVWIKIFHREPQLQDMMAETASHLEIGPGNTKKRKKDKGKYMLGVFSKRKKTDTSTIDSVVKFPIHKHLNVDMGSTRNLAKEEDLEKKVIRSTKKSRNQKANDYDSDYRLLGEHHMQGKEDIPKTVEHVLEYKVERPLVDDKSNQPERHRGMISPSSDAEYKNKRKKKRSAKKEVHDKDGMQYEDQTNIMAQQIVFDENRQMGNDVQKNQENSLVVDGNTLFEGQSGMRSPSSDAGGIKKRNKKKNRKASDKDPQDMDEINIMPVQNVLNGHQVRGEDDSLKRGEHGLEKKEQGSSVDGENTPSERHRGVRNPLSDAEKKQKKNRSAKRESNNTDSLQGKDQTNMSVQVQIVPDEHHLQGNHEGLERVEQELEQDRERSLVGNEITPSEGQGVLQSPSDSGRKKKRNKKKNPKASDKDTQDMDKVDIMPAQNVSNEQHLQGEDDSLKGVEHGLEKKEHGSFIDGENTSSERPRGVRSPEKKRKKKKRSRKMEANHTDSLQGKDQTLMSVQIVSDEHLVQGNDSGLEKVEQELKQGQERSTVDDEKTPSEGQVETKSPSSDTEGMKKNKKRMNKKANDKGGFDQTNTQNVGNVDNVHGKDDKLKKIERELKHDEEISLVGDENTHSEGQSVTKLFTYEAEETERKSKRRKSGKRIDIDSLQTMRHMDTISKDDNLKRVECASVKVKGSVLDDENPPFEGQSRIQTLSPGSVSKKNRNRIRKNQKGVDTDGLTEFPEIEKKFIDNSKNLVDFEAKENERRLQILNQTDIFLTPKKSDEQHLQEKDDKLKGVELEFEQQVKEFHVTDENTPSEGVCGIKDPSSDAKGKRKKKKKKGRKVENELGRALEASSVNDKNIPSEMQNETKIPTSDAEVDSIVPLTLVNKVDKLLKEIPSPEKTLITIPRRKLLILDLNGLLADVIMPPPKDCKSDMNILGRAVFKRPFFLDFFMFCLERFDVAIWSSRTKKVIDRIVDYLLGTLREKLLFCWDSSPCTLSQFKTLENKHKPLVFKELKKIWEINDPNLPWKKEDYDESNTLLLDDSPYKALLNPMHTAIFPRSYSYKDKMTDNSLGPGGDLRVYLEKLSTAENVQKYVEQHPFGQRPIDQTCRFWSFYSKVLQSRSSVSIQTVLPT